MLGHRVVDPFRRPPWSLAPSRGTVFVFIVSQSDYSLSLGRQYKYTYLPSMTNQTYVFLFL